MTELQKTTTIRKYTPQGWEETSTAVPIEAQVALSVNGEAWLTFLCTPTQLEALGVGFLFNEGVITSLAAIQSIQVCDNATHIDAWLDHAVNRPPYWLRTTGCGGGTTQSVAESQVALPGEGWKLSPQCLLQLMEQFLESQRLHQHSGGMHSAAISDGESLRLQVEDIGRHNTLDKLAGLVLLENIDISPRILLTTGRVSSEMLQKAARLHVSVLISRTSPTDLSVEQADKAGITLVGYTRGGRFSVYTHPGVIG